MKKSHIALLLFLLSLLIATQFSGNLKVSELSFQEIPADFEYDGCSMFPDGNYGDCCKEHDDVYFFGGAWQSRLQADTDLMSCVMQK